MDFSIKLPIKWYIATLVPRGCKKLIFKGLTLRTFNIRNVSMELAKKFRMPYCMPVFLSSASLLCLLHDILGFRVSAIFVFTNKVKKGNVISHDLFS